MEFNVLIRYIYRLIEPYYIRCARILSIEYVIYFYFTQTKDPFMTIFVNKCFILINFKNWSISLSSFQNWQVLNTLIDHQILLWIFKRLNIAWSSTEYCRTLITFNFWVYIITYSRVISCGSNVLHLLHFFVFHKTFRFTNRSFHAGTIGKITFIFLNNWFIIVIYTLSTWKKDGAVVSYTRGCKIYCQTSHRF